MAEDRIDSVVDPKVYKQIDDLTSKLQQSQKALIDNVDAAIKFNATLGNSKTLPDMEKNAGNAAIAMEKLKQSQIQTELAQGRLSAANLKAQIQAEKHNKTINEQNREYVKLDNSLKAATKSAQDIGIIYGKNSKEFIKASKEVKALRQSFVDVDAALGIHNRSVGNYTNSIKDALYNLLPFGSQLGRIARAAEEVSGVIQATSLRVGSLGLALGTIPVAATAIAASGLISYFATTQEGMDKLRYAVEPFKIALKQAFGELQEFGRSTAGILDNLMKKIPSIGRSGAGIGTADRPVNVGYAGEFATDEDFKAVKERNRIAKEIVDLQIQIEKNDAENIIQKAELNRTVKFQSEIARDAAKSENERIKAAKNAIGALNEWMTLESADINLKIKLLKLEQSLTKEGTQSRAGQLALNTLLAERADLEAETAQKRIRLTGVINKTEKGLAKDQEEADKKAIESAQNKEDARKKFFEQTIKDAHTQLDIRVKLADAEVKKEQDLAKQVSDINKKNLEAQRASLDAFSQMLEDSEKKKKDILDKAEKEDEERREKKFESILKHEQQVFDVATAFLSARFQKETDAINEIEKLQQTAFEVEVDRINKSLLSDQDKANKLSILEAQRAAQKQQNDRKEREIEIRKAKFDKQTALFQIAIQTAVNVIKLLLTPPLALAAGIAGAAQAAVVLATPLPKFEKGGKMHHSGLAEYGHGTELRIDPDGKVSITGSKPEVGFVKKDTQFISNKELVRMLAKPDPIVYAGGSAIDIKELIESNDKNGKAIVGAVRELKQRDRGINYYSTARGQAYKNRNLN